LENGSVKTERNKKLGMVMFFTTYPPIDNLYESITQMRNLSVSKSWSFGILKVTKNGKVGYVGENGVEYFRD
jgi:hypothetical protein